MFRSHPCKGRAASPDLLQVAAAVLCTAAALASGCATSSSSVDDRRGFVDAIESERLLQIARRSYEAGDLEATERTLRQALESNPFDGRIHYNLGVIELNTGRLTSAVERFERAAELMPQAVEPQLGIAYALLQTGHYELAADIFKQALGLDPTNSNASKGLLLALNQADGIQGEK